MAEDIVTEEEVQQPDPELKALEDQLREIPVIGDEETPSTPAALPEEEGTPPAEKIESPVKDQPPVIPDEIPEDVEPSKENWSNFRELFKGLKKQNKELEDRISKFETVPTPPIETAPPVEEGPTLSDDDIFVSLAKARYSEYGDDQSNNTIEKAAMEAVAVMSPAEILNVREKAAKKVFGDYSDDILKYTEPALVEATAREQTRLMREQIQGEEQKKYGDQITESFGRVLEKHPELNSKESPERKALDEWWNANVYRRNEKGEIVEQGILMPLLSDPNFPEKMLPLFEGHLIAAKVGDVQAIQKENKALKQKLDARQTPLDDSGPVGGSPETEDQELADLANRLAAMPVGGIR